MTQRFERAIHAARLTGDANLPPVMNHLMRKLNPVILRDDSHQFLLYLLGIGLLRQAQTFGYA